MKEKIKKELEYLDDYSLIQIFNEYCDRNYYEDHIYDNDDDFLDNHFASPSEAMKKAYNGDYSYNHKYVQINGCGNIESSDDINDLISYNDLADYIVRNDEDFGNEEIREALDKADDEGEDDEG
jgi:hypothetical protein